MRVSLRIPCLIVLLWIPTLAYGDGAAPAVSDPNGKFSVEGGEYDGNRSALALGSYSMPLGHAFGLQADGALGRLDEETMGGGGLHLFARDPSSYLLGVYGSFHTWDSIDIWRTAAEFQLYMHQFSLEGLAGYEGVNVPSTSGGLVVLNSDDDHFFGQIDLAYYLMDDLRLYGGYRYVNETSLGGAGVEYLLRAYDSPISVFARADFGDDEYNRITGGLRVYFGGNKTLIERYRTEDPENYTPMFPKIRTQAPQAAGLPQCTVDSGFVVIAPANGQCICPPGTFQPGSPPTPFNGSFVCFSPN